MKVRSAAAAFLTALTCAVSPVTHAESPVREAVLHPGQSVEARNRFGRVKVSYVSPLERRYEWDGGSRIVTLRARDYRFRDELGLYDAGNCLVIVIPLCRTPRLVVREALHNFANYDQAYAFLHEGSAVMDWVYTSDGLVVGIGRSPGRKQLAIDVRQLTVGGAKPRELKGARDTAVKLTPRPAN